MAHTYTPGLRVTAETTIRKERRLPISGKVLVSTGDRVAATDIVASAELPGNVATVNVVSLLGIPASDIESYMLKKEGDSVRQGEVIAETRPLIKWFRNSVSAPVDGEIETVSHITGQVIIRMAPRPVALTAYVDGTVVTVHENEGVTVATSCAFIQGILGIGGEVHGELALIGDCRLATVTPDAIDGSMAGKIVVVGSLVSLDLYRRAAEVGVAALVCGGFNDIDLKALLGRDLGVAITGREEVSPILIITEGFGDIPMAESTYELLVAHAGRMTSASGATQIRAGVLRPEILIPKATGEAPLTAPARSEPEGLQEGTRVRIIREPYFGRLGRVSRLPSALETVESGIKVRVVEIVCDGGENTVVPRANVEAIES